MNSYTDDDFTSKKTRKGKRNSLQPNQQKQIDNVSIASSSSSSSSKNNKEKRQRRTFNLIFKPSTESNTTATIHEAATTSKKSNNTKANPAVELSVSKISSIDLNELKKSWKVGTLVEARDLHDNWYKSRIIEIDEANKRVKVHFFGWNSRYDQWFNLFSNDLKPFNEGSLNSSLESSHTKSSLTESVKQEDVTVDEPEEKFNVGDKILAKWIDSFFIQQLLIVF